MRASPKRVCEKEVMGALPHVPGLGGEAEKANQVPEQPGTEQPKERKEGRRGKGARRRLVLV